MSSKVAGEFQISSGSGVWMEVTVGPAVWSSATVSFISQTNACGLSIFDYSSSPGLSGTS